jgi:chromate transporter
MKARKPLFPLFISMLKIGLFTFGGGYAMIRLLEDEFVNRKRWIDLDEFMDLVAIAESTPGPIAINCATYIGYKKAGVWGSVFATLGMVIPSFTIIYLISLFFDRFLSVTWIASAFRGIQACVIFLILSAGVRMLKKIKKSVYTVTVMLATFACMITFSLFGVKISSVFYILISGAAGLLLYTVRYIKGKHMGPEIGERK